MLRLRNRAVTTEDFEFLALQASPAVGRAKCLGPDSAGGANKAGVVRLLLVPRLGEPDNAPTNGRDLVPLPRDLRLPPRTVTEVRAYLDERRLLTTVLEVDEPEYLFLSTDISVVAAPDTDPQALQPRLVHALQSYFHPTRGGFGGEGLPFGGTLTLSDIYAQIQRVPGVAFLQSAPKAYLSRLRSVREGILGDEEPLALETEDLRLEPHQILVTRSHRVSVRSMRAGV
jgi:predicted phage baseplate assembly protein